MYIRKFTNLSTFFFCLNFIRIVRSFESFSSAQIAPVVKHIHRIRMQFPKTTFARLFVVSIKLVLYIYK